MRTLSLYLLALVLVGLAAVVRRARPAAINNWFATFTLAMAAWVIGIAGVETGVSTEFWGRVTFASASMLPPTFLAFSHVYPASAAWPPQWTRSIVLTFGVALGILALTSPFIAFDIVRTPDGIRRTPGILYPVFTAYFLICTLGAFAVLINKWLHARGLARAQLQYLAAGFILLASGAVTTNLLIPALTGRSDYSWLGPYFTLPFVFLVAHTIIRHRLMDLRLVIHRGLAYVILLAVASGTILALGRFAVASWHQPLGLSVETAVLVFSVLLLLTNPSATIIRRFVDSYLFRRRLDHAAALRVATSRLTRLLPPDDFAHELRDILHSAYLPEALAILIRDDAGSYEGGAKESIDAVTRIKLAEVLDHVQSPSVILISAPDPSIRNAADRHWLRGRGIEIIATLGRRGHSLGAVVVGPRRSGDPYFTTDLSFVGSIAELASIALENSLLYRQRLRMLEYSDRLLESISSGVIAIDTSGRITSLNWAARRLLAPRDRDTLDSIADLPSPIAWALVIAVKGAWQAQESELTVDSPGRGSIPVVISTAILHGAGSADGDEISGALAVVTDLSAVKALERNQRRLEHFATMTRLYAGIAHEIRSPLASISNFVAMLPDRFDDAEYRDTVARLLPLEVSRIVKLADRLRFMAPSEGGKLAPVQLSDLLTDIVALHGPPANERGIRITVECPDDLPRVLGDEAQLVQLFVNLLNNSVEAMPSGGDISIRALHHRPSFSNQSLVLVDVVDEGIGITPEIRPKVFEPFFTTKPHGTGLGLSICKEIADFHRARLTVGAGTNMRGTIARVEFAALETPDAPDTLNVADEGAVQLGVRRSKQ